MFKWINKRRKNKQLQTQRNATRQLLTLAGFSVSRYAASSEFCHLCGEEMTMFYATHTETSPHGEELTLRNKQGCSCLRCGFVQKHDTLYGKPLPFHVFINDYLERQLA
jgi:hypothetical protein